MRPAISMASSRRRSYSGVRSPPTPLWHRRDFGCEIFPEPKVPDLAASLEEPLPAGLVVIGADNDPAELSAPVEIVRHVVRFRGAVVDGDAPTREGCAGRARSGEHRLTTPGIRSSGGSIGRLPRARSCSHPNPVRLRWPRRIRPRRLPGPERRAGRPWPSGGWACAVSPQGPPRWMPARSPSPRSGAWQAPVGEAGVAPLSPRLDEGRPNAGKARVHCRSTGGAAVRTLQGKGSSAGLRVARRHAHLAVA